MTQPKLNYLNFLNVIGYVLNVVANLVFGVSTGSASIENIISPAGWAFSIWGLIFATELIFTIAQLLPKYRASDLVQKGVSWWYFLSCVLQAAWLVAFTSYNSYGISLIIIVLLWLSLLGILLAQDNCDPKRSLLEYFLLQFPFSVHCAWITVATILNVNIFAVALGASISLQLAIAFASLACLPAFTISSLFGITKPNFVFPVVFLWAASAIYTKLLDPSASIVQSFGDAIPYVQLATLAAIFSTGVLLVLRLILCFVPQFLLEMLGVINHPNPNCSVHKAGTIEIVTGVPVENERTNLTLEIKVV